MDLMDYRRKIIANSPHLKSASGAVVSFSDGADLPLKSLIVGIEPVQDLHGYDYPWVGGGGKNILPIPTWFNAGYSYAINGITFTVLADGGIKVTGTNSVASFTDFYLSRSAASPALNPLFVPTGDYILIADGTNTDVGFITSGSGNNGFPYADLRNNAYKTGSVTDETKPFNYFLVRVAASATVDTVVYAQLVKGSSVVPWSPYENICPISGWSAVNVTRTGKNLLPMEIQSGSYGNGVTITVNPDLSITYNKPNGNNWTTNALGTFWLPAGTYTLIEDDDSAQNGRISLKKLPSNTEIINTRWAKKQVFTLTETTQIYADFSRASQATDLVIKFMLFEGDTATASDYAPYNGVNVSIDLGQTVYGVTINPLTGVLTVDRLGVPMESLTWYRSTSYANPIFYTTITGKASDYRKSACSILRNIGSSTIIAAKGFATQSADGDFASSNGNAQIYARYDSATTVQEFVTAVTGQTIVYPLANPVTIQLTPQQIRSLYGNNTIFADTGNVALEYWAHP